MTILRRPSYSATERIWRSFRSCRRNQVRLQMLEDAYREGAYQRQHALVTLRRLIAQRWRERELGELDLPELRRLIAQREREREPGELDPPELVTLRRLIAQRERERERELGELDLPEQVVDDVNGSIIRASHIDHARETVDSLPLISIEQRHLDEGSVTCVICLNDLLYGESAIQLPCSHLYHKDCITGWFQYRYSCPVCRSTPDDI